MSVRVLVGDCRAVLAGLPAESVQCVVTSPPYWGLRDYGTATWEGGRDDCTHRAVATGSTQNKGNNAREGTPFIRECGLCGATRVDSQLGLERTPEEYVARMVEVFRAVRRVLRDDGTCWINLGDSYAQSEIRHRNGKSGSTINSTVGDWIDGTAQTGRKMSHNLKPKDLVGIPWRVAFALQADGWWLRSEVIWAKPNPMPESVTDRPTKAHEQVFLLSKSASYHYDAEAVAEEATNRDPANLTHKMQQASGIVLGRRENPNGGLLNMGPSATRNARSVWSIATQPFSGAHFATMPPELAKRCILAGTSPRACEHCGAPWARVWEHGKIQSSGGSDTSTRTASANDFSPLRQGKNAYNAGQMIQRERITTGWAPTCTCDGNTGAGRCTVLDPFAGAGTSLLVADRLGRDGIGIELNPEYAEMARERVRNDNPLFTDVA